jgi:hypothetical protein
MSFNFIFKLISVFGLASVVGITSAAETIFPQVILLKDAFASQLRGISFSYFNVVI